MYIRTAESDDAKQLVKLIKQIENSNFMLFEPGERKTTVDQQRKRIEAMSGEKTSTILVAEENGLLVGYLFAMGGNPVRVKHAVYLAIGVAESSRGQGVGAKLFAKLEEWAKERTIHRLELTVMVHNKAAIALYEKMGFEIEGTKRHSLFVDGNYVDEYYMSKLL